MYLKNKQIPPFPSYNVLEFIESGGETIVTHDYQYTLTRGKQKGTLPEIPKEEVIDQLKEMNKDPF